MAGRRWVLLTIAVMAAGLIAPRPAPAAPRGAVDAVLVLDSSGSMKHTDPQRLRVPAAKLFISLLSAGDRVGVISFSTRAWPVLGLTAVSAPDDRRRLFAAVDKVSSKGLHTNLYDALDAAREMLARDPRPHAKRYIILMSDGRMDTGDPSRDAGLTRQLTDQELPALDRAGIQVYSIAFTKSSDVALLRDVAHRTHGLFRLAEHDRDLHNVFTTLFESAKNPEMLPIQGGEFMADSSIREVTVVASKDNAKVRIYLQAPDGTRYTAAHPVPHARWFTSQRFDMITVPKPQPGTWKILFSQGENKAYIVTNLGLDSNVDEKDVPLGNTRTVEAWLSKGGSVLKQPEVLQETHFLAEIQRSDGELSRYTLFDNGHFGDTTAHDGVYTDEVRFYKPGAYVLRLIAKGPTFQRETTRYFQVVAPPPQPKAPAAPVPKPASPKPATPKPAALKPPPAPSAPAPAAPLSVGRLLLLFLTTNVVLAAMLSGGYGVWRVLRRRARANTPDAPGEADESASDTARG